MAESNLPLISLRSVDGKTFNVLPIIVKQMKAIQSIMENTLSISNTSPVIPFPNVGAFELSNIINYLDYHHVIREGGENDEESKEFDEKFMKGFSGEELKMLLTAANYLNVEDLVELMLEATAKHIENKSVEYVWKLFGIESRFTPEEEEEIRQRNPWAYVGINED